MTVRCSSLNIEHVVNISMAQDLDQKIWWVLQRIQTSKSLHDADTKRWYIHEDKPFEIGAGDPTAPPYSMQLSILERLEASGAVQLGPRILSTDLESATDVPLEKGWYRPLTVASDFKEVYRKYTNDSSPQEVEVDEWWEVGDKPSFDPKLGQIKLGKRVCQIPLEGLNQIVICDALFSRNSGDWTTETEVVHGLYRGGVSKRSFYDAIVAINKATLAQLGFKLLQYKASRVRIKSELFK